jgi:hypothetical protein
MPVSDKDLEKLMFDFLDGEGSLDDEHLLEKECQASSELNRKRKSFEEIISILRQSGHLSENLTPSPGFTEKVMARLERKPAGFFNGILLWIRSPLDLHLHWALKWSTAFMLIVFIWAGIGWHYSQVQNLQVQMSQLEGQVSDLMSQSTPIKFFFCHTDAQSVHLVGSFNDWQVDEKFQLVNINGEGIWAATVSLEPGQYEYMFLVDRQEWVTDPVAMDYHFDGFGYKNSVIEVSREIHI